jgi:isopentenyldiphosphate isomerase
VVHLHVFNSKGELFLQKRPMFKKVQPGKWDTVVGGHISWGEDVTISLQREAQEEMGISAFNPRELKTYIWESDIEREYVHCFITEYNDKITFNKEEIADGRFWSTKEIEENIGKGSFTPNFEKEYTDILSSIKKK